MGQPLIINPAVDDPSSTPWMTRTDELLAAFTREVQGPEAVPSGLDPIAIASAAWLIWGHTQGEPCWGQLDLDAWLARLDAIPGWHSDMTCEAVLALYAFYCFLLKHNHVSYEQIASITSLLEPLSWVASQSLGLLGPALTELRSERGRQWLH